MVKPEFEKELSAFLNSISTGDSCFVECDETLEGKVELHNSSSICINTNLYQEAGSNSVNELAFSMAHLNEYLNLASSSVKTIHLNISVGGDFFMEIAKLRTLRKLTNFLLSQYNIKATVHIHAQTTLINKSVVDSYNNMLRSTTEAMSASIGGANSIVVLPFDVEFNSQNDFSSRMARNQQLILKDESYLDKMADVACGSYYIEKLTDLIATKALDTIKSFEKQGGYFSCLEKNVIVDEIQNQAAVKKQRLETKTQIVVGVNKFKNEKETIQLSAATIKQLEHLPINNPTLDFELTHYFKTNA
jgi:methylmalonyl-CoA mutase